MLGPGRVPGHHRSQLPNPARARIVPEQQVQDRHEVALAASEAAVQVRRLAAVPVQGAANEVERCVEAPDELGRDNVVAERLGGLLDALGEAQNEVPTMDVLGEIDQLFDRGQLLFVVA